MNEEVVDEMEMLEVFCRKDVIDRIMDSSGSLSLLRGVPLSTIVCKRHILNDSVGEDDTYALSRPVRHLDSFVSHSWSANPTLKHIALVVYQYRALGYAVANLTLICLITCLSSTLSNSLSFLIAYLTSLISFLLSLFYGCHLPCYTDSMVFFDKCCICQTNKVSKLRGIWGLSSYLASSNELLVLWSSDYFKRLWCVFEVASFVQQHSMTRNIRLVSIRQMKFSFVVFIIEAMCVTLISILDIVSSHSENKAAYQRCTVVVCLILAALWGVFIVYEYLPHRMDLDRQASEFTIADAECSVRKDKLLIHRIIKRWYGSLEAFEIYVRERKEYVINRKRPWTISGFTLSIISLPMELACVGRLLAYYCTTGPLGVEWWITLRSFFSIMFLLLCRLPLLVFVAYIFLGNRRVVKWCKAFVMVSVSIIYELILLATGGSLALASLDIFTEPYGSVAFIIPVFALFYTCKIYRRDYTKVHDGQL